VRLPFFSSPIESFGPIHLRVCVCVCVLTPLLGIVFLLFCFFYAGLVSVLALKLRLWLLFCTSFWWPKVLTSALLGGGLCLNQK